MGKQCACTSVDKLPANHVLVVYSKDYLPALHLVSSDCLQQLSVNMSIPTNPSSARYHKQAWNSETLTYSSLLWLSVNLTKCCLGFSRLILSTKNTNLHSMPAKVNKQSQETGASQKNFQGKQTSSTSMNYSTFSLLKVQSWIGL